MDGRDRQRTVYVSAKQKKKLLNLLTKHPELVACKVGSGSNFKELQRAWQNIAAECNAIPGARKSWRQWRKTWQDMKSKYKKRQLARQALPASVVMLSQAEQEVLGLKNVSSTTSQQESTELPIDPNNHENEFNNDVVSNASYSEPESLPEQKVFAQGFSKVEKIRNILDAQSDHSNNCTFDCDKIAALERRKVEMKEDYLNFKKDYLRQKLKIMKEQTDALKSIAKELKK